MKGDILISPSDAELVQRQGRERDFLVMWTVTWNPSDYPNKVVARPSYIGGGSVFALNAVLVTDSFHTLRDDLLPRGLSKVERHSTDDPAIVEVWL
jgi:hypothetical protein